MDTPIPTELENLWLLWKENVSEFSKIEIPRWHGFCNETPKGFYVFADASTVAYWEAAYFRFRDQNDQIKHSLIIGKSRLSPRKEKSFTIPRLKLQAAVIATRMKTHIIEDSEIQPSNIYLWSDSKVVLNYTKNVDTNFGSYIAHRINEFRSNMDIKQMELYPKQF